MSINVENLVRSAVVAAIGLPISAGVVISALPDSVNEATIAQNRVKAQLTEPCLKYALSKVDSKLERESQDEIDKVLGGEVDYKETCNWAL